MRAFCSHSVDVPVEGKIDANALFQIMPEGKNRVQSDSEIKTCQANLPKLSDKELK